MIPNTNPFLKIYTVSFFGHRFTDNFKEIEDRLEKLIINLLCEHEYVDFLVGRNGDFDQIVSSTIKKVKREFRDDNCTHILVLPYHCAEFQNNENYFAEYYDEIEICHQSKTVHFKSAIQTRNKDMVGRSDLVVFYVAHNSGGAYQTFRYALKQGKDTVNLADNHQQ